MAVTALDLIKRAMRSIGSIEPGEDPSADEATDFLVSLNNMIAEWGTENLTCFTTARTEYPLTSNVQAYTIGPGGAFNQQRPLWISTAGIISNNNPQQPLELTLSILTVDQWQRTPVKNVASALPMSLYYDHGFVGGLGTIYFWPIPSVTNLEVALYTPTALSEFSSLTTQYTFPPGYENAIRYNLAVAIATELAQEVPATVFELAMSSKGNIKRANIMPVDLRLDDGILSRGTLFNYYTGEPL